MNANPNQEEPVVYVPQSGEKTTQLHLDDLQIKQLALKQVISHLVDHAYAAEAAVQHKLSKPFIHNPPQPALHRILPAIAAGRLGKMISHLPPVALKDSPEKK